MKKTDITISWFLLGLLTLITAYIFIFPMLWGISTSLKSSSYAGMARSRI